MDVTATWVLIVWLTLFTFAQPQFQRDCSCQVHLDGWSCSISDLDVYPDWSLGNNTIDRTDYLIISDLDKKNGKIVNKKYYHPKPRVSWVISHEELMSSETYNLIYHAEVSESAIGGHPICYNIRPYATKNTTARGSNVTVSVDCLGYLGGDSDAALIRVRSVPPENSKINAWQSHVIIDAPKKGLSIDERDYDGETVMVIQNSSCSRAPITVDLMIRNHTRPYSLNLLYSNNSEMKYLETSLTTSHSSGFVRLEVGVSPEAGKYSVEVRDDSPPKDYKPNPTHTWYQSVFFTLTDSCQTATELLPGGQPEVQTAERRTRSDVSGETQYIAIAFGTIGGVILIILVVLGVIIQRHCTHKHNTPYKVKFKEDGKDNNPAPTISMERPSVYIIYYPDDKYHKNVVRHFADFLNEYCDVRIDIQDAESIMQLSKPTYVVQQWKNVRCVLMINSKGAYKSFEENKDTSSVCSPTDGTFFPAMQQLRAWALLKDSKKKGQAVAFANFGYTEKKYRLYHDRYPQFQLMKDVTELLSTIYGNNFQVIENFKNHETYKNISRAIELAEQFYKSGHRNSDQLDSGVGPSVDDETRPAILSYRDEEMVPLIPNNWVMTEDNHLRSTHKAASQKICNRDQDYPSQFKAYLSPSSDRGLHRGNSPQSSPAKAILHFHAPSFRRSSSESLEKIPCSTDHKPPHQYQNPRQQVHPDNIESIQSSMFPHYTTDGSTKFTGDEPVLAEESMNVIASGSHSAPPQFSRRFTSEMPPRLRHQDVQFEPPDVETDTEDNLMIAPSEIDRSFCSASSIHSSDQELALQMINMEEDWSS